MKFYTIFLIKKSIFIYKNRFLDLKRVSFRPNANTTISGKKGLPTLFARPYIKSWLYVKVLERRAKESRINVHPHLNAARPVVDTDSSMVAIVHRPLSPSERLAPPPLSPKNKTS